MDIINNGYQVDDNCLMTSCLQDLIKNKFIIGSECDEDGLVEKMKENVCNPTDILTITIIPTLNCNFRCIYCSQEHIQNTLVTDDLCSAIIKYVKKNIDNYESLNIRWFGGEPLCSFHKLKSLMKKIAILCVSKKKNLFSSMSSNGYLLTPTVFKELYKLGLTNYQITIDGFAYTHDKLRVTKTGKGSYEKIISNLIYIKENTHYKKAKILIRINLCRDVLSNIDNFINYLGKLFGCDRRFMVDFQVIRDMGGESVDKIKNQMINVDDVCIYVKKAQEANLNTEIYTNIFHPNNVEMCLAAVNNFYIFNYNGEIKKCTAMLDSEVNIIGALNSYGEVELKNNISKWNKRNKNEKCNNCKYYPLCYGLACPYHNIMQHQPKCPKYILYLEKNLPLLYELYRIN